MLKFNHINFNIMASTNIYKSPREISSFLLKIHSKVQRKEFTLYNSRHIASDLLGEISQETLIAETRDMLEYCGLLGYAVDVKYVGLSEGQAGNILLNNSAEKAVHIQVSDQFRNNGWATLAILAHEVCHKVLYVNGLYVMDDTVNETFVELTTIYMGFGELILKGYRSRANGVEQALGYLYFNVYKVTHYIMCITSGKMKLSETDLESADPVAYDTLEKWEKNGRNTDMLNEILYDSEKSASVTHRYITLLEEVLKHFKGTLKEDYSKKHKEVFGSIDGTDRIKSDLATFSVLYESVLNESDTNTIHDINPVDEVLETTLYDIHTKILKGTALNKGKHVCPCCGTVINDSAAKNDILVRCPSCRVRFRSNNAEWTPTSVQRKINRKRNEEEERFNSLVHSEVESRLETERKAAVAQTKKDILKSMPGWLRWLAEDYFE